MLWEYSNNIIVTTSCHSYSLIFISSTAFKQQCLEVKVLEVLTNGCLSILAGSIYGGTQHCVLIVCQWMPYALLCFVRQCTTPGWYTLITEIIRKASRLCNKVPIQQVQALFNPRTWTTKEVMSYYSLAPRSNDFISSSTLSTFAKIL